MRNDPDYKELGQRIRALLIENRESLENDTDSLLPVSDHIRDHYDLILGNMSQGIVISRGNKIVYVNKALQKMTGYGLDDLRELSLRDVVHTDDLAEVKKILKRRRSSFKPNTFSLRMFTKKGELRWMDISTWHMNIGDESCSIDFIDDITEKMETELELEEYRRRLQLAIEATSDGLWDVNVMTGEASVNTRWFEMLGYEPGEIEIDNSQWLGLVHPDDRKFVEKTRIIDTTRDKTYNEMEFRLRTKTGSYRWVLSRGRVVEWDPEGRPLRIVGTHVDITDLKRTSELLSLQRDIAVELALSTSIDYAMEKILEGLSQVEGVECGGIYLFDAKNNQFILRRHRGLSRAFAEHVQISMPEEHILSKLRKGESFYSPYLELYPEEDAIRSQEGLRCLGVNPILKDDQLIGIINVGSKTYRYIPSQSRSVVESLAAHISLVISKLITEERIKESERHYRTLFSAAPLGVGVTDPEGHMIDYNTALLNMFDYTEQDFRDFTIDSAYKNPETRKKVMALLEKTGVVEKMELVFLKKSGEEVMTRLTVRSLKKEGQTFYLALVEDITEEKKRLQKLEQSEHKNRAILAAIPDMIFRFDDRGNIIEFKPARDFDPYTSPSEFMGRRICDVLPIDVCDIIMEKVTLSLSSGRTVNVIYELDLGSAKRTYEGRIASISDKEGIIMIRDITDFRP